MPLKLIKRGAKRGRKNWYLRGSIRGISVDESTGTDDKKLAEVIRIKKESELLQRSVFGASATVTFAQAAAAYVEGGGEQRFIGEIYPDGRRTLILKILGDTLLCNIGRAEVDACAKALYPRSKASSRLRHCYKPIKAVLRFGAKQQPPWCQVPIFDSPKIDAVVTTFSTPERLAKLLPHCSPELRRFIFVMVCTGARLSEILRIDWDKHVSLSARKIVFPKTKTKQRAVHIPDQLLIELSSVPEHLRHGRMIHWKENSGPRQALKRACERAGVDYLPPHQQGRHTFGTWLLEAGASLKDVMDAGGWADVHSVMRYLHTTTSEAGKKSDLFPLIDVKQKNASEGGANPGRAIPEKSNKSLKTKR